MSFNPEIKSGRSGLIASLAFPFALSFAMTQFACTPSSSIKKPQFSAKDSANGEGDVTVPGTGPESTPGGATPIPAIPVATGDVTVPTPVIPTPAVPKSITVTEAAGLKLGLKAPQGCAEATTAKSMGLGAYINFEVLEDNTQITLSLARLCGDVTKKNIVSLINSSGQVVMSQALATKEITTKTQIFGSSSLAKGKYTVAIETAGSSIDTVSSLFVGGAVLEGTKGIKLESLSEF